MKKRVYMFPIYTSKSTRDIERGRLWKITSRKTGVVKFMLGSMHLPGNILLQAGTPELYAILRSVDNVLFEFNKIVDYKEDGPAVLDAILNWPEIDPQLKRASLEFVVKHSELYINFTKSMIEIIRDYFQTKHKLDVDVARLQQLHFSLLHNLFLYVNNCQTAMVYAADKYDWVLMQECMDHKSVDAVVNIEPFTQTVRAELTALMQMDPEQLNSWVLGCMRNSAPLFDPNAIAIYSLNMQRQRGYDYSMEYEYFGGTWKFPSEALYSRIMRARDDQMYQTIQEKHAKDTALLVVGISHCPGILRAYAADEHDVERVIETPNLRLLIDQMFWDSVPYLLACAAALFLLELRLVKLALVLLTAYQVSRQIHWPLAIHEAWIKNSGPEFMQAEMLRRSRELYRSGQPINKFGMLTQYNQARTLQPAQNQLQFVPIEEYADRTIAAVRAALR